MKISEYYKTRKHVFSFEFFPPKSPEAEKKLFDAVGELKTLAPAFTSVTYGAMGGTRGGTIGIATRIKKEYGIEAATHLTCIAHTQDEIEAILQELTEKEIENIVALRGDILPDSNFKPIPGGFLYGRDLVRFIRNHPKFKNKFSLAVAGYPEGHVECKDLKKDLAHLKEKVDAGADVIITQLFFNPIDYFDFVERVRKAGIKIPVVPGVMPVANGAQIQRFARMCGASIPKEMQSKIEKYGDDQAAVEAYGIEYASHQCAKLIEGGIPGIHFYTLNKSRPTQEIFKNISSLAR